MCQYSAINGRPSKWHYNHLNKLCKTGAGLVMLESTAVNKQGKNFKKRFSFRKQYTSKIFKKNCSKFKKK